ncbi:hypothetical protein VM1G_02329 [Cytospora mali]|uniref:Uncharacterized protein n=1 Tax=Cytospora mali TaxID=578113 RepID=A0A194VQ10_CYTMA|nr:hypothetical protein VM1G_02329 [Valsa mali]
MDQPLQDKIECLTPPDRLQTQETANSPLDDEIMHSKAWEKIFKQRDWLEAMHSRGANPVLLGHGVEALFEGRDDPVYLILLPMDRFSNPGEDWSPKQFFATLQDYNYKQEHGEISLRDTNITINIADIIPATEPRAKGLGFTKLQNVGKVFREDATTAVLYYTGPQNPQSPLTKTKTYDIRTYNSPKDIAGMIPVRVKMSG